MNRETTSRLALAAVIGAMGIGAASAGVTVIFTKPENYADMPITQSEKDRVMKSLQEHFTKIGAKLPEGQDLKIEVIDLDMAGRLKMTGAAALDLRIMNGRADWPSMKLKYTLESQGKVIKSGEERIADMDYMGRLNPYPSSEPLRYEKQMIDDWFKKKIAPPAQ